MLIYFIADGEAITDAYFGQGVGNIWLDEVSCTLYNDNLNSCSSYPIGVTDCTHSEDAGVRCEGMNN